MENAAEALKMAFAVFIFVIALTLVFSVISQARATADAVFTLHDREVSFYDKLTGSTNLSSVNGTPRRIVTWSTVVPTIYRYKQENYGVTIIDNGKIVARFSGKTEELAGNYFSKRESPVGEIDINKHIDYLNDNILKPLNCTPLKEYHYTDNEHTDNSLYQLFYTLYRTEKSNLNAFGSLWLQGNNSMHIVNRLDADLGDKDKTVIFSGGEYKGLKLGGSKSDKSNRKKFYKEEDFIEYFKTVEPHNENDQEIFEIIYVVK